MIKTNSINIVISMNNPYDYREFCIKCEKTNIKPMSWVEYAQKTQALLSAIAKYPLLTPTEAYLQLIKDQNGMLIPPKSTNFKEENTPCNSCGGGKVR